MYYREHSQELFKRIHYAPLFGTCKITPQAPPFPVFVSLPQLQDLSRLTQVQPAATRMAKRWSAWHEKLGVQSNCSVWGWQGLGRSYCCVHPPKSMPKRRQTDYTQLSVREGCEAMQLQCRIHNRVDKIFTMRAVKQVSQKLRWNILAAPVPLTNAISGDELGHKW